jgi:hypothetical protein
MIEVTSMLLRIPSLGMFDIVTLGEIDLLDQDTKVNKEDVVDPQRRAGAFVS